MKIIVDADACPVKEIIISCAKKHALEVVMVCDVAHMLFYNEDFITVITVDQGADSADLAIANRTQADDICITQDYGLASLILAKKATVLHPNGFVYSQETIDRMLFERHLSREMRRQKKSRGGHIRKRTKEDDEKFLDALERAIQKIRLLLYKRVAVFFFYSGLIRAIPSSIATSATALATASATFLFKADGMIFSACSSSSEIIAAMA